MNLDKILAISGKPGLYVLKMQTRTGFVAESLLDGKKITVGLRSNVSLLSEISMYTETGEAPLADVMRKIAVKQDNGAAPSHKEGTDTLVGYFEEILPDYDKDRVYASDIKKVMNWYNILQAKDMVSKEAPIKEDKKADDIETSEVPESVEKTQDKPKAKAKPKAKKE